MHQNTDSWIVEHLRNIMLDWLCLSVASYYLILFWKIRWWCSLAALIVLKKVPSHRYQVLLPLIKCWAPSVQRAETITLTEYSAVSITHFSFNLINKNCTRLTFLWWIIKSSENSENLHYSCGSFCIYFGTCLHKYQFVYCILYFFVF